jgi:PH (Pleckstrin Homology) domain-containing protein
MAAPIALPHTWRPYGARLVGTVLGAMLLALVIAVWIAWGADVRSRFTVLQRSTLISIGVLAFVGWYALVRSRVTADDRGVTVVNGFRSRVFEWSQVLSINLRRGAPWAGLDLSDGTSVVLFAIQGSDGQRAVRAVRELRELVAANTRVERDD